MSTALLTFRKTIFAAIPHPLILAGALAGSVGGASGVQAALRVTSSSLAEGNDRAAPNEAVFTVSSSEEDDDVPVVSLELPSVWEPASGQRLVTGSVVLETESDSAVTVTWETAGGTAREGEDYSPGSGEVTIPAGALYAPLSVTIHSDSLVESSEAFSIRITGVSGARTTEPTSAWMIRDCDRPSVAHAEDIVCAEGTPPVNAVVNLFPGAEPFALSARAMKPTLTGSRVSAPAAVYAEPGVDWPDGPIAFPPQSSGFGLLPLAGTDDNKADGHRRGVMRFDLPAGWVGSSFSERLVDTNSGDAVVMSGFSSLTTDGQWAAAIRYGPEGKSVVLYRKTALPGGEWMPSGTLPVSMNESAWSGAFLKLRKGRIVLYSPVTGECRIFRQPADGAGPWELEASPDPLPFDGVQGRMPADFDGETLVLAPNSAHLVFVNRGNGAWADRQVVDLPSSNWSSGALICLEEGRLAVAAQTQSPSNAITFLERVGTGPASWRVNPVSRLDLPGVTTIDQLLTDGDLLVVNRRIFRLQDDASWVFEQEFPAAVRALGRGVVLGYASIFADTGPPSGRWEAMGKTPPNLGTDFLLDFHAGVVVTSRTLGNDSTLTIMEAGMGLTILDRETFTITPSVARVREPARSETDALISLTTQGFPAPVDIPVAFRTVAGGTATPDQDYRAVQGIAIIRAGSRNAYFSLPILPDAIPEGPETVHVELGTSVFGKVLPSPFSVEIEGSPLLAVSPSPVFVPEPVAVATVYQIPVGISPVSSTEVTATYQISAGTASAQDVELVTSGTVTVPAGARTILIPLTVYPDTLAEGPETARVSLRSAGPMPAAPPPISLMSFDVTIDDRASAGNETDSFAAPQNTGIAFDPGRNVLANDTAGHTVVRGARAPAHGTVQWREDGTFSYVPEPNFRGIDRFAYSSCRFSLPEDTNWKWLHPLNGRDPALTVPGFQTNWMKPFFDASSWQNGRGLMAYGAIGEGNGEPADTDIKTPGSGGRYTAYFRTSVTLPASPEAGMSIEFICDDAAIFYLNGSEAGRFAKTSGGSFASATDSYTLLAPSAMDDGEETRVRQLSFPAAQMLAGENIIAVSVHNSSNSSSDLGIKVTGITPGAFSTPTWVTVDVTDAGSPPVVRDDSYSPPRESQAPWNSPILDSWLLGGSVYGNDGLMAESGLLYDPILEAELQGADASSVRFDKDTGQFFIPASPNFYGDIFFSYRVRDKDGWSNAAKVSVRVPPSREYDIWRADAFGAGSFASAGLPEMDEDRDGTSDLLEFLFWRNPAAADFVSPLTLEWNGSAWALRFPARAGFGTGISLRLESSPSLTQPDWTWLATLNDYYTPLTHLAPGVTYTRAPLFGGVGGTTVYGYTFHLPDDAGRRRYFRLRAIQSANALAPE